MSQFLVPPAIDTVVTVSIHYSVVEIMGYAEMMETLRQGIRDVQEGNLVSIDEV